jgi:hypothetical protein
MAKLDPDDVVAAAAALRCAELTRPPKTCARGIRAGEVGLASEFVRIENLADRAERRLAGLEQGKQKPATQALADFIATVAEQEGEAS